MKFITFFIKFHSIVGGIQVFCLLTGTVSFLIYRKRLPNPAVLALNVLVD